MNVGERIKTRRKQLKLSADGLGEKLGKNRATIYRYESNEIENMPLEVLEPLAKALNVSPTYLMGWGAKDESPLSSNYNHYPVSVAAGLPDNIKSVNDDDTEQISIPDSIMGKWAGKDVFITKVNGESMNKVIPNGSLIAVKSIELVNLKDDDIVVFSDDNDYSVKRFYKYDNKIIFRPDSNDIRFTDYITSTDNQNLKIHGKVVVYIVELD